MKTVFIDATDTMGTDGAFFADEIEIAECLKTLGWERPDSLVEYEVPDELAAIMGDRKFSTLSQFEHFLEKCGWEMTCRSSKFGTWGHTFQKTNN